MDALPSFARLSERTVQALAAFVDAVLAQEEAPRAEALAPEPTFHVPPALLRVQQEYFDSPY